MRRFNLSVVLGVMALLAMQTAMVVAQEGGAAPAERGERGQRGQRGQVDTARMDEWRRQRETRLKEQLTLSDEEWSAIQPMIERVQRLQGGGFGGRGGAPGGAPGAAPAPGAPEPSPVAIASRELRETLQDTAQSDDAVARKVAALREARRKQQEELVEARKALREVLTVRQEALLVTMNILD